MPVNACAGCIAVSFPIRPESITTGKIVPLSPFAFFQKQNKHCAADQVYSCRWVGLVCHLSPVVVWAQVVALFQELRNFLSDNGMMDLNLAEPGDASGASANGLSAHSSSESDDPSSRTGAASKVHLFPVSWLEVLLL